MSWIASNPLSIFQKFCINVLKCGPIPQHVAFIMDGNRRYAKQQRLDKQVGHSRGFDKLTETLQWCLELGIREVTMYAFSIENFNRSQEEVDALMDLAREKYARLIEEKEKLMEEGVRISVIGNLTLLPEDIRKSIAEAMIMTKHNSRLFLNVAMAYTSRDEITNAVIDITNGVKSGKLGTEDIDEELLNSCLYTNHSRKIDVLIRTSGETRLSDFLLWQSGFVQIFIADVLWPNFSIWQLLGMIFKYQRNYRELQRVTVECRALELSTKQQVFLDDLGCSRMGNLEQYTTLYT
ncbi:hypothetical protein PPYR_12950 [Photinus pyralis]|uniref:Alkyl transferase n=1 Tax=Photinus pyralis TaxID=7054 RepID=A0A1Y1N9T0_PHOPY|nr:dehydrodolichyl diphosphate synthase complex subunit DHDDS-like [Photinus pyralis]KAB0793330.1 hypothetical protein PPYR_12950 [Photinus pyralis]